MIIDSLRTGLAAALLAGTMLTPALAHDRSDHGDHHPAELFKPDVEHAVGAATGQVGGRRPPLYDGLGNISMPITTTNPTAQAYFDQGLRLICPTRRTSRS